MLKRKKSVSIDHDCSERGRCAVNRSDSVCIDQTFQRKVVVNVSGVASNDDDGDNDYGDNDDDKFDRSSIIVAPPPLEFEELTMGGRLLDRAATPRFVAVFPNAAELGGVLGVVGRRYSSVLPITLLPTGVRLRLVADDGLSLVTVDVPRDAFVTFDNELSAAHTLFVLSAVFRQRQLFRPTCTLELATQVTAGNNNVLTVRQCPANGSRGASVCTLRLPLIDNSRSTLPDLDDGVFDDEFSMHLSTLSTIVELFSNDADNDDWLMFSTALDSLAVTQYRFRGVTHASVGAQYCRRRVLTAHSGAASTCVLIAHMRHAIELSQRSNCSTVSVSFARAAARYDNNTPPLRIRFAPATRDGVAATVYIAPVALPPTTLATIENLQPCLRALSRRSVPPTLRYADALLTLLARTTRDCKHAVGTLVAARTFLAVFADASVLGRLLGHLPTSALRITLSSDGLQMSVRDRSSTMPAVMIVVVDMPKSSFQFYEFASMRTVTVDTRPILRHLHAFRPSSLLTLAAQFANDAFDVLAIETRQNVDVDGECAATTALGLPMKIADERVPIVGDNSAAFGDVVLTMHVSLFGAIVAEIVGDNAVFAISLDSLSVSSRRNGDSVKRCVALTPSTSGAFLAGDDGGCCRVWRRRQQQQQQQQSARVDLSLGNHRVWTAHLRRVVALINAADCSHVSLAFGDAQVCIRGCRDHFTVGTHLSYVNNAVDD